MQPNLDGAQTDGLIIPMDFYDQRQMPLTPSGETSIASEKHSPQDGTIMPLSWLSEQAHDELEDSSTAICVNTDNLPPLVSGSTEMMPDFLSPAAERNMGSALTKTPVYAAESKPTPYSTANKFAKAVPLVTVGDKLYRYNGTYYEHLTLSEAQRQIMDICRSDIECTGSPNHLRATYDLLLAEPRLSRQGAEPTRRVVSFQNGLLDLVSGRLLPHTPYEFVRYSVQCNYWGLSKMPLCPVFDQYLTHAMGGDAALVERVYEMIGYILTPDTDGKVFFLLQGTPNSGKSVLCALLASFFNVGAVASLDVHALSEKFAASTLEGKAICLSPDLPSGALDEKAASKLKQLTGNDVISADVKFRDRIQFRCTAKIILASNHLLLTKERDMAFVERIVAIPFFYSVSKEQRDPFLLDRITAERDAIATKAIAAYFRLVRNSYCFAGEYEANSASFLYEGNAPVDMASTVYSFLRLYFVRDESSGIFISEAHQIFTERYGGIAVNPFSQYFAEFANQLYGATKARKRKEGEANATSFVSGIRFTGGIS